MNRPSHLMSVPLDIPSGVAQLDEIYKGIALYNTGLVTLAYRMPVVLRNISIGGERLFAPGFAFGADAGRRIELEFAVRWPEGEHPMLPRKP